MNLSCSHAHLPSSVRQLPAECHSLQEAVWWWGEAGRRPEFLSSFFQLSPSSRESTLIMLTLLLMTPTVFLIVRRVFDLGDKAVARLRSLRKPKR